MIWTAKHLRWLMLGVLAIGGAWLAYGLTSAPGPFSVEQYLAETKGSSLAPPGYTIEGAPITCAKVQLVLNPSIDDVAEAFPGFIIVNPTRFDKLPRVVRLYAFGHECGHQLHGPSEEMADCYSVTRGEAQGWLNATGIDAICEFWKPFAGDNKHLPGPARCELMRQCFAKAKAARG